VVSSGGHGGSTLIVVGRGMGLVCGCLEEEYSDCVECGTFVAGS